MRKNTPHKSAKVIIAILSLSVSLSFMAGNNVAFQSSKPIARVEYWQQRQIQIEQLLLDKPALSKVKLLFLGDSITDFWMMGEDLWVQNQWHGKRIWDESFIGTPPENTAQNFGISGDRTEHILYRIQPKKDGGLGELDSPELNPDYIIIMLGINNSWAPEYPVTDSIYEGVSTVVRTVHKLKPHAHIILESILPTNDPVKNANVVKPVNQRLAALIISTEFSGSVSYLDLYPAFIDVSGKQIANYFVQDGLHPNENGYQVWRDKLLPFMTSDRKKRSQNQH